MKRLVFSIVVVLLVAGLLSRAVEAQEGYVTIVVAPSTLNLQSSGNWVTVHAEIPFSAVLVGTVFLNGIPATHLKADACGELVAKFWADDVKTEVADVAPGVATMLLEGMSDSGPFSGQDQIRVINRGGKYGNRFGQ